MARLTRIDDLERIVVVCYANINRSPYAAALLNRALAGHGMAVRVEQGGFFGPGRSTPEPARSIASSRGIDLRSHKSRFITRDDVSGRSLVIAMEEWHAVRVERSFGIDRRRILLLGDLDPEPVSSRSIVDPVGGSPELFTEVYDRIERCVAELARGLTERRSAP
jgi:protein-tyrosine-phosphatase